MTRTCGRLGWMVCALLAMAGCPGKPPEPSGGPDYPSPQELAAIQRRLLDRLAVPGEDRPELVPAAVIAGASRVAADYDLFRTAVRVSRVGQEWRVVIVPVGADGIIADGPGGDFFFNDKGKLIREADLQRLIQ